MGEGVKTRVMFILVRSLVIKPIVLAMDLVEKVAKDNTFI